MLGDELDRAGADITDRARRCDRQLAEFFALSVAEPRRGRLLDNLLMPALDRAVALPEMHDVALRIPKHLHLDMARPLEIALEEDSVISERARRLALRADQRAGEFVGARHDPHAAAAAAGRGLDQHGIADALGFGRERCSILRLAMITGHHGH